MMGHSSSARPVYRSRQTESTGRFALTPAYQRHAGYIAATATAHTAYITGQDVPRGKAQAVTDATVTAAVTGLLSVLPSDCDVRYERNVVQAWQFDVDLSQSARLDPEGWEPTQPSRYLVARNIVRMTQNRPLTTVGIRAVDDFANGPRDRRLDAWVAKNDVEMAGPSAAMRFGVRLVGSVGAALVNSLWANDIPHEAVRPPFSACRGVGPRSGSSTVHARGVLQVGPGGIM